MRSYRCDKCGGEMDVDVRSSLAVCQYCGAQTPIPHLTDDRKESLYKRANHLRRANEFDKAAGIYESIIAEDASDAGAYWGQVLCKYGIQYVEDDRTGRRVPTCNRLQARPILSDPDYLLTLEHADESTRPVYEQMAAEIQDIQTQILSISVKEEPYQVFICYKELDNSNERTPDSVLAQEIYNALTKEGIRVFFARISLEDKIGRNYEPYIYAALNSAQIMITVSTRKEYINAPWVKNEWSRYLAMIQKGEKKELYPVYKDMNPSDLPPEFKLLEAQNMGKIGALQDLVYGIKKRVRPLPAHTNQPPQNTVSRQPVNLPSETEAILDRAKIYLEDGDFANAKTYCERFLDKAPRDYRGYWYAFLAEKKMRRIEELANTLTPIEGENYFRKAVQFAPEPERLRLESVAAVIRQNREDSRAREEAERLRIKREKMNALEGQRNALADELDRETRDGETRRITISRKEENCRSQITELNEKYEESKKKLSTLEVKQNKGKKKGLFRKLLRLIYLVSLGYMGYTYYNHRMAAAVRTAFDPEKELKSLQSFGNYMYNNLMYIVKRIQLGGTARLNYEMRQERFWIAAAFAVMCVGTALLLLSIIVKLFRRSGRKRTAKKIETLTKSMTEMNEKISKLNAEARGYQKDQEEIQRGLQQKRTKLEELDREIRKMNQSWNEQQ